MEIKSNENPAGLNLDNWEYFCSFARWWPDVFLDLIKPEKGGLNLHFDQRIFLRCAVRFVSFYGVFSRGYGKCVTGDTLIYTSNGIKEMGCFFNYNNSGEETYYLTQEEIVNRYGQKESTLGGIYSGKHETVSITTSEGYKIEGTKKHPILVLGRSGEPEFKKLGEITENDIILINRKNNLWGNSLNINKEKELSEWVSNLSKQSSSHLNIREMPSILTENIAEVIGYLIGDGCLSFEKFIIFTNKDEDILNLFKNVMSEDFKVKYIKQTTDIDYKINDTYLRKYLELLGIGYEKADKKVVPQFILDSPKNICSAFLRGLFDTDGTVDSKVVSFTSASEKLIDQVRVMLLNYGIIVTKEKKTNKDGFISYRIIISGKDVRLFKEFIGFRIVYKKEKLDKICSKKSNTNRDVIPIDNQIIIDFYNDVKKYNKGCWKGLSHILSGECRLTYEKLHYLLSLDNAEVCKNYKLLKDIEETNYFYTTIKEISSSFKDVYDFHVPNTHSFVSNGIISHNTFDEVLAAELCCIFFPNITISLTAQTRENAAGLIRAKHEEIMRFYPMLKNEVVKENFSNDKAEVVFKSGGILTNLANAQSSKGKRRSRLNIEESAQVDNETFMDCIQPIVEVPRVCVGKYSLVDPEEVHQQINFFTTSWYKGTSEYDRSVQMVKDMVNLNGKMVLGASFWLACWFGRGSTKSQILQKKKDMSPTAFALNYESKWVGAVDGALVSIEKLSECRVLSKPILQREKDEDEFYIGVDVARSADTANNQSSISVIKVKRNKVGKVMHLDVVNVLNVSNTKNFINQAIAIKRLQKLYGAEMVVVDANGLGIGLCDILHTELEDPLTGEIYTAWKSINTEEDIDAEDYEECLFELKAQQSGVQNKVVVDFIDAVDNGKLRMLESRRDDSFTDKEKEKYQACVLPFVQTDFMFEEIANLKMKTLGNGGVTVEKTVSKMNKDRFSSLSYVIYYIMEYCNNIEINQQSTLELLMDYTFL